MRMGESSTRKDGERAAYETRPKSREKRYSEGQARRPRARLGGHGTSMSNWCKMMVSSKYTANQEDKKRWRASGATRTVRRVTEQGCFCIGTTCDKCILNRQHETPLTRDRSALPASRRREDW